MSFELPTTPAFVRGGLISLKAHLLAGPVELVLETRAEWREEVSHAFVDAHGDFPLPALLGELRAGETSLFDPQRVTLRQRERARSRRGSVRRRNLNPPPS